METLETKKEYNERMNRNENLYQLRSEIRKLSQEQRELKNQRKTVNLVGERTMEVWKAIAQHQQNRQRLCLLYAAYNILRNKEVVIPKIWKESPSDEKFYINTVIQEVVDEFSKEWLPDHIDEWKAIDKKRHEDIMKELNLA